MAHTGKNREKLGDRLTGILTRLNNGETLDTHALAAEYSVSLRTIQRDIGRFGHLLDDTKGRHYTLNRNRHGYLSQNDIARICRFASIQELFPEADRRFFQEKLAQSITVKGFQYEDIRHKTAEFDLIAQAVAQRNILSFDYAKAGGGERKSYRIEPYRLLNKNGIWYLVGLDQGKQKTYCFTQIENLKKQPETFLPDQDTARRINETDSLYHGSHLSEIVIRTDAEAAPYFKRRPLLPNQETIRELEDGSLLLACKNASPLEVVPIVRYWIPHVSIVSPAGLQEKMEQELRAYLGGNPNLNNMG